MLYIVATPIGNLEDMTFRAIRILKEVDYIFSEDTRVSRKLLNHYEIDKHLSQYHEHNKQYQIENIINLLKEGKNIALITDAGTPCISDPGYELVNEAHNNDIEVVCLPGASSLVSAASISGLSMRRFVFEGFLPKKKGRQTLFNSLKEEKRNIIIFESPNRLIKTLKDILDYLGDRYIVIARELTKKFETIKRGTCKELIKYYEDKNIKGEIVIIINGNYE